MTLQPMASRALELRAAQRRGGPGAEARGAGGGEEGPPAAERGQQRLLEDRHRQVVAEVGLRGRGGGRRWSGHCAVWHCAVRVPKGPKLPCAAGQGGGRARAAGLTCREAGDAPTCSAKPPRTAAARPSSTCWRRSAVAFRWVVYLVASQRLCAVLKTPRHLAEVDGAVEKPAEQPDHVAERDVPGAAGRGRGSLHPLC